MRFAQWTFAIAGIYGLAVLLPQYFLEAQYGIDNPPPITHPEFFYGFIGVAVAFQFVFLIIATDPRRYRPLMLLSVLEKVSFGSAVGILYLQGRMSGPLLLGAALDMLLAILFVASFVLTRRPPELQTTSEYVH